MSLSVKYIDAPPGAQEDATAVSTPMQSFGVADNLISGVPDKPFATLEPFSWPLDGSRELFDDTPYKVGWWSKERTDDNGRFVEPPVISITFTRPFTATGITVAFWPSLEQWCNEIRVNWYNNDEMLNQVTEAPNSPIWVVEKTVENFNKITIELLGTNIPGQFAKIQQIQIGHMVIFMQDEISRVSLLNEIDPSLCELSADTMKVEIVERKGRKIIPQETQSMYLYRDGIQIASQYIAEYSREGENLYTFSCQSAIGLLEDVYLGGIYPPGSPVKNSINNILAGFKVDLGPFKNAKIEGYIPACTKREALQQIAFAIGAVVTTQGDGTIRFAPLSEVVEAEFTGNNIFTGAKVTRESKFDTVQVTCHSYKEIDESEVLLEEEQINGDGVLYVFHEPHHEYSITGGTIKSRGHNWVKISANGKVTLTGKKYLHSTSVKNLKNQNAIDSERENVLSVEKATLVHSGNVDDILERLYNFSVLRDVLTQEVVVTDQKAGQLAKSEAPWGPQIVGYITSMESEFTNTGHTASITIRGKEEENAVNYRQNKK